MWPPDHRNRLERLTSYHWVHSLHLYIIFPVTLKTLQNYTILQMHLDPGPLAVLSISIFLSPSPSITILDSFWRFPLLLKFFSSVYLSRELMAACLNMEAKSRNTTYTELERRRYEHQILLTTDFLPSIAWVILSTQKMNVYGDINLYNIKSNYE